MNQRTPNDLEAAIRELVDLTFRANCLYRIEPAKPVMRPAASERELDALAAELARRGLPLPPSYRQFLSVANGVKAFSGALDLVSAKGVLKPVDEELEEDFPALSRFVIGRGNTPQFIGFDPDSPAPDGEMPLVWVMADGGQFRYASFAAMIVETRDHFRETLGLEAADRAGLKD